MADVIDTGTRAHQPSADTRGASLPRRIAMVEINDLRDELKLCRHIIAVLKMHGTLLYKSGKGVEDRFRVRNGRVQTFGCGGWTDVDEEEADE